MCELFSVHRSSYKYWCRCKQIINLKRLEERAMVTKLFNESRGSAGSRTVAAQASACGMDLSRYRARGLMKALNLVSRQQRTHRYRKNNEQHLIIPNHLDRQFNVAERMGWSTHR